MYPLLKLIEPFNQLFHFRVRGYLYFYSIGACTHTYVHPHEDNFKKQGTCGLVHMV